LISVLLLLFAFVVVVVGGYDVVCVAGVVVTVGVIFGDVGIYI